MQRRHHRQPATPRRARCVRLVLLAFAAATVSAHAAGVFKCSGRDGEVAYQDRPCPVDAAAAVIEIAPAPRWQPSPEYALAVTAPPRARAPRHAAAREPTSFECHAGDGRVFYRHAACPHAVAADPFAPRASSNRGARGTDARVAVTAQRISRDEACRHIHAAGAIGRRGHEFDDDVSTYERNLGRDPCR